MALPSPVPRTNQKITKPQFFESYKSERTNISNLDIASAYITKKAANSSIALSEKPFDTSSTEGVWGGIHSRYNLAVEMIPMMINIQNASGSKLNGPLHMAELTLRSAFAVDGAGLGFTTLLVDRVWRYGDRRQDGCGTR